MAEVPGPDDDAKADLDIGDMPGAWQVLAVVVFFVVLAGVFGLPWLLGYHWLWDYGRLVGPVVGALYFFGTRRWWLARSGVTAPSGAPARKHDVSDTRSAHPAGERHESGDRGDDVLAELRRRAQLALFRWWATLAAVLITIFVVLPVGRSTTNSVNRLIDSQPHQYLRVLSVATSTFGRSGPDITVEVPDDGPETLSFSDYVSPVPNVGDTVDVVVDPHDHSTVIPVAYRHSSDNSLGTAILLCVGIAAGFAFTGWFMGGPTKRAAARAVRRATATQHVTVTAARGKTFTVTTEDGTVLTWQLAGDRIARAPSAATRLEVAGDLCDGGWAAAKYRHWVLWTVKPLRPGE